MSDNLVKRLRTPMNGVTVQQVFTERGEAANEIFALQAHIEELEAKLAKAVGDLGRLSRAEVFGDGGAWGMRLSEDALGREILARMKFARTTLAELTGGKDE